MRERFSEAQMLRLVEMYRDHECLWDATNPLYKNKSARESAYKQIWQNLNIPELSLKDLAKKIKNIRYSYNQEVRRIESSVRSGASLESIYKPKLSWFTIADGFLGTCRNAPQTLSNMDAYLNIDMSTSENGFATLHVEEGTSISNTEEISKLNNNIEASTSQTQEKQVTVPETRAIIAPRRSMKKSKSPKTSDDEEDIYQALAKIDKITEKLNSRSEDDEFDIFGKYIAATLRSLPPEVSVTGKLEIQKTLSEVQLKVIRQNNASK